jgi:hypothetical protein
LGPEVISIESEIVSQQVDDNSDAFFTDALEYFGLGNRGNTETAFVFGYLKRSKESVLDCELEKDGKHITVEFLKTEISVTRTGTDTALIEIPKIFVPIFQLEAFVLIEAEIDKHRRSGEMNTSPYLPPRERKEPEKIGSVVI